MFFSTFLTKARTCFSRLSDKLSYFKYSKDLSLLFDFMTILAARLWSFIGIHQYLVLVQNCRKVVDKQHEQ